MKIIFIVFIYFLSLGCTLQPNDSSTKKITEAEVTILNWPFPAIYCDRCDTRKKQRFTPLGPEKYLSIYKDSSLIAFTIESRIAKMSYEGFNFVFLAEGIVDLCHSKQCKPLNLNQKVTLSKCTFILTDYQFTASRKNIADSGSQLFKVAAQCNLQG
jgi:hypothetical protein